ncbi:MAG: hypothetical protein R2867_27720 [Caldilineaceae bacterium]
MIQSPSDSESRYGQKRTTEWDGYKVHLTETCDPDLPRLITQVTTTPAARPDCDVTAEIQEDLVKRGTQPNILWITATPMPGSLSQVNATTLTWSVLLPPMAVGKPKLVRALTSLVSRLTGTTKSQPVPGAAERHLVGWHR